MFPFQVWIIIIIFIHYKLRIAVDLDENDLKWMVNEKKDIVIIETVPRKFSF